MKNVQTATLRNIKVLVNSDNKDSQRWARIKDVDTGVVLHTGRVNYIKRIAKVKYNKAVNI